MKATAASITTLEVDGLFAFLSTLNMVDEINTEENE